MPPTHLHRTKSTQPNIAVIGSGMGALSAAALLAQQGYHINIYEQNWLPGGCSSSYPRKHFIFESGATTLIGLDEGMPLHYLLETTGIQIPAIPLKTPMQVVLKNGTMVTRHQDREQWIQEAEQKFGPEGQRDFWQLCYRLSDFVWDAALRYRSFPPTSIKDFGNMARAFSFKDLPPMRYNFYSMAQLLEQHNLHYNQPFLEFIDQQLLITAQNKRHEVNALFGAASLCYTNYTNYYIKGGMINLVKPIIDHIEQLGGQLHLRTKVEQITRQHDHYTIHTNQGNVEADYLIAGIPLNNLTSLMGGLLRKAQYQKILPPEQLNSAFTLGIAFKTAQKPSILHHQIHLEKPLPYIHSDSIFISFSHPQDHTRCPEDMVVASISTHLPRPHEHHIQDKTILEQAILDTLEVKGFLNQADIVYQHSSTQRSWQKWTDRQHGFVGGYPQHLSLKPWHMPDARLDGHKAYLCGDTAYPGQGIPGVCLSGIIAAEKLLQDWGQSSRAAAAVF